MDLNLLYLTVAELVGLLVISAYFSASETAVMALNRHRLQQWAQSGHAEAGRVLLDARERVASPDGGRLRS